MLIAPHPCRRRHSGYTLLEVLITVVVLAIGLLGLANLQMMVHVSDAEAFQRAQAVNLLQDIAGRIEVNRANAADYVTGTDNPLGTGDGQPADCTTLAIGVVRDRCEWSNALKGAAEKKGTDDVGAMLGARGCVTQIQAENASAGVCNAGIYRITIAWQGMQETRAPGLACGKDLYGTDAHRRVVSSTVVVGLPSCL